MWVSCRNRKMQRQKSINLYRQLYLLSKSDKRLNTDHTYMSLWVYGTFPGHSLSRKPSYYIHRIPVGTLWMQSLFCPTLQVLLVGAANIQTASTTQRIQSLIDPGKRVGIFDSSCVQFSQVYTKHKSAIFPPDKNNLWSEATGRVYHTHLYFLEHSRRSSPWTLFEWMFIGEMEFMFN